MKVRVLIQRAFSARDLRFASGTSPRAAASARTLRRTPRPSCAACAEVRCRRAISSFIAAQFRFRLSRHRPAFVGRFHALRKQLLDFLQRESEPLRVADETQAVKHLVGIIPVTREVPPRRRKQPSPLVEANRINTHSRRISYSANSHLNPHARPLTIVQSQARRLIRRQRGHVLEVQRLVVDSARGRRDPARELTGRGDRLHQ